MPKITIRGRESDFPGELREHTRGRLARWCVITYLALVSVYLVTGIAVAAWASDQSAAQRVVDSVFDRVLKSIEPIVLIATGFYFGSSEG